jgi:hypothetical protein
MTGDGQAAASSEMRPGLSSRSLGLAPGPGGRVRRAEGIVQPASRADLRCPFVMRRSAPLEVKHGGG